MARIEVKSVQRGVASVTVEVDHITDAQVEQVHHELARLLEAEDQVSTGVAKAFVFATQLCPQANPSDLWQHVIYRGLMELGWSDQRWKRVSGFALERAFVELYNPRLAPYHIRLRILPGPETERVLEALDLTGEVKKSKIDLFIEGQIDGVWGVFGAVHAKSSIAERIQDDVPASQAFIEKGLLSVVLTMDSKSYPPPHGNGVNYGELGARSHGVEKNRMKRDYVEIDGQFDGLFSFNLRTPPSAGNTESGKRIYTLSLHEPQPDAFVRLLVEAFGEHQPSGKPA